MNAAVGRRTTAAQTRSKNERDNKARPEPLIHFGDEVYIDCPYVLHLRTIQLKSLIGRSITNSYDKLIRHMHRSYEAT